MKAAIYAARLLICSAVIAQTALARAQPPHGPPARGPEMAAGWRAPPPNPPARAAAPAAASTAPRGNLRGDIENNARWNDNPARPRPPPPR